MRTPVLLAFVFCACAEPAIEMSLELPRQVPAGYDLSCVTAVDVAPHVDRPEPFDIGTRLQVNGKADPCVDIAPQTTFEGLREQLRGKVSFALPDELVGIQLRGRVGTCKDDPSYHEAIVYSGADFTDGDLELPLVPNISCSQREAYRVRPLDIVAMIADPAHACQGAPPQATTYPSVSRPSLLGLVPVIYEGGTGAAGIDPTTGTATLQSFAQTTSSDACISVGYSTQEGLAGATCVNKNAPLLCGTGGEIEIPTFPGLFIPEVGLLDDAAYAQAGAVVLGTVWETGPNTPLAGATVTAPNGVKVEYIEMRNGTLEKLAQASTGPSGLFLVYTAKVIAISVTAPGHQPRTLTVTGLPGYRGDTLAVLPKL